MDRGRPSGFTEELADIICERMIGGESLRSICRDDDMPSVTSVMRWLAANEDFREQYARAREAQADYLAEEILEIGDAATPETAQVARLQCDNRKWFAGKTAPKKYGDRFLMENRTELSFARETDEEFFAQFNDRAAKLGFDAAPVMRRIEDLRSKTIDGEAEEV